MIAPATLHDLAVAAGLGNASIFLVSVGDPDEPVGLEPEHPIYPASMIKTPLAVAVAIAERDGRLRWDERVGISPANMTANDAPSPLTPHGTATIRELVELMLSRSDNVATNVLIDVVGRERAGNDLAALGFADTVIARKLSGALPLIDDPAATGRNAHGAREAAELFHRIACDAVPGAAFIARALAKQYWNTKLSAGLQPGDVFAHKTGDTDEVSHDGGILTLVSGERYVITVYTTLPSNADTDERFGTFMRALRPALSPSPS